VSKVRKIYDTVARYASKERNESGRFYPPINIGVIDFYGEVGDYDRAWLHRLCIWPQSKEPYEGISMWPEEAEELGRKLIAASIAMREAKVSY